MGNEMTEEEWLACKEPTEMLSHLGIGQHHGKVQISPKSWASPKKKSEIDNLLRLFACACCRRIWDIITETAAHNAVEIAEDFANGRATAKELKAASIAAAQCTMDDEEILDAGIDLHYSNLAIVAAMQASAKPCNPFLVSQNAAEASETEEEEKAAQCGLLRDVVGNPFLENPS